MFEVWEDFKIILEIQNLGFYNSQKNKGIINYQMKNLPIKKKVFEFLSSLVQQKPEFLYGMGRIENEILPVIMIQFGMNAFDSRDDKT